MDTILTITGSDNTGGSGVQADIRAITELGGRMVSVVTCITIQNTLGIQEFYDIPAQVVADQIEAIGNDMQPPIVKVGMVRNLQTLSVIINYLRRYKPSYVIYDPVVFSSNGDLLMESHLIGMIRQHLLPLCSLILLRRKESTLVLGNTSPDNVSLLDDTPVHGYSNLLSTAITYYLSQGNSINEAMQKASEYLRIHVSPEDSSHNRSTELYRDFTKAITAYLSSGMTPKAIIEQHLEDAICNELLNTGKTIQEIAYEYQFSSQAHFTKFFKRITGYTPSNYRKNHIQ